MSVRGILSKRLAQSRKYSRFKLGGSRSRVGNDKHLGNVSGILLGRNTADDPLGKSRSLS